MIEVGLRALRVGVWYHFLGSGLEGVDDLCFHTYREFSEKLGFEGGGMEDEKEAKIPNMSESRAGHVYR